MPQRALPNGLKLGFIEVEDESAGDERCAAPRPSMVKPYEKPKAATRKPQPPPRLRSKKYKCLKPRKPRVLCQETTTDRVEAYAKSLKEYYRQLRMYVYHCNVVDKCNETQLREFLSRVIMRVVQCLVAEDTVHGEYVEKATLRCDLDAMHIVDSFLITLYKKDDCIDKFSKDMLLLEEILMDFCYSKLAIKYGFDYKVADCVGEVSEEAEKLVKGLTREDKDRMERRWKLWLDKTTFDDCQMGPFNRHELSKLCKPPYTVEYQVERNSSGAFTRLSPDEVSPFALCHKKLSEMPEISTSTGEVIIYEKGIEPTRSHKDLCELIHGISKCPRAQAAAKRTDVNSIFAYVR